MVKKLLLIFCLGLVSCSHTPEQLRVTGPVFGTTYSIIYDSSQNFETAFYRSTIADNNSFEQWEQDGAKTAEVRANEQWKQMLESYAPPPLDEGLDEALQAFIKERKSSFEDRDY